MTNSLYSPTIEYTQRATHKKMNSTKTNAKKVENISSVQSCKTTLVLKMRVVCVCLLMIIFECFFFHRQAMFFFSLSPSRKKIRRRKIDDLTHFETHERIFFSHIYIFIYNWAQTWTREVVGGDFWIYCDFLSLSGALKKELRWLSNMSDFLLLRHFSTP